MAARVNFLAKPVDPSELNAPPKLIVSSDAVVERDGKQVLFVVEGGRVRLVSVTLGEAIGASAAAGSRPSSYVLINGPPVGTRIVKTPGPSLTDGVEVKVAGF